jgi:hypothetical protein
LFRGACVSFPWGWNLIIFQKYVSCLSDAERLTSKDILSSLSNHLDGLEISTPKKTALFAHLMRYRLLDVALWMQGEATRELWAPGDDVRLEHSTKLVSYLRLSLQELHIHLFNSLYGSSITGLSSFAAGLRLLIAVSTR